MDVLRAAARDHDVDSPRHGDWAPRSLAASDNRALSPHAFVLLCAQMESARRGVEFGVDIKVTSPNCLYFSILGALFRVRSRHHFEVPINTIKPVDILWDGPVDDERISSSAASIIPRARATTLSGS